MLNLDCTYPRPQSNWIINHTLKILPNFLGSVPSSGTICLVTRESALFYFLVEDHVWYRLCCKTSFRVFLISISIAMDLLLRISSLGICCVGQLNLPSQNMVFWLACSVSGPGGCEINLLFQRAGGRGAVAQMKTEGSFQTYFSGWRKPM